MDLKKYYDRVSELIKDAKDECINYRTLNEQGYGSIQLMCDGKKKKLLTHRMSFEISTGKQIEKGMVIMHSCDNPSCINPSHLSMGTHADNVADKVSKGRQAKGTQNGRYTHGYYSKYNKVEKPEPAFESINRRLLTYEQVISLKKELKNKGKQTLPQISKKTGISLNTVKDVHYGKSYVNVF